MVSSRSKPISHFVLCCSLLLHPMRGVTPAPGEKLAPDDQQVIDMAIQEDIWSLEPDQATNFWQHYILDMVLEPLVRFEGAGKIVPAAVTHWEPNADKTVWRFHLRQNGKWSNGDSVNADDFVRTYQNYCDPGIRTKLHKVFLEGFPLKNACHVFEEKLPINELGVRSVNPYTLELTFERPMEENALFTMLTHPMFAPVHLSFLDAIRRHQQPSETYHTRHHRFIPNTNPAPLKDELSSEQRQTYADHPFISNGPFSIQNLRFGTIINTTKNPHYWDSKNIILKKINWKFTHLTPRDFWKVGPEENAWNMTCVRNIPTCPKDRYSKVFENWAVEYTSPSTQATDLLLLNTRSEKLKEVKVRRALDILLNRKAVVKMVLDRSPRSLKRDPNEEVSYTLVPPQSNYTPDYRPKFADWDEDKCLAQGEALLRQAGYSPKHPLVLKLSLIARGESTHQLFKIFSIQLFRSALIALDLEIVPVEKRNAVLTKGTFELIFLRYTTHGEVPESIFRVCKSSGALGTATGLCDHLYDETVDRAIGVSKGYNQSYSGTERYALLRSAEARLMQKHALLPISHFKTSFVVKRNISGLINAHHPIGYLDLRQLYVVTQDLDSGISSIPFFEIFCDIF